jgi:zinc-ribbon domain
MICGKCNTRIPDTAKFCPKCGIRVEGPERYLKAEGLTDELVVEPPIITPHVAGPGDKIKQELQFTLLSPREERRFKVTKIIDISIGKDTIELARRKSGMTQGTHISILQFVMPRDIEPGEYKITTATGIEKRRKIVHGSLKVKS